MKYGSIAFLLICLIIALSACGGDAKQTSGSFGENDLQFEVNSKVFELNSDVKSILAALGDGYTFSEAPSCVYDGTDKTYEYPGISIYTFPQDQKDCIDEIVLTGNTYKTGKGVTVGSTLEDLVAAYGSDYRDEDGVITYRLKPDDLKSPCLYFVMDEGRVSSVSYYSASNIK